MWQLTKVVQVRTSSRSQFLWDECVFSGIRTSHFGTAIIIKLCWTLPVVNWTFWKLYLLPSSGLRKGKDRIHSGRHSFNGSIWEWSPPPPFLLLMTEADLACESCNINIPKTVNNIDRNFIMNNRPLLPISRIRNLFQQACVPRETLPIWQSAACGTLPHLTACWTKPGTYSSRPACRLRNPSSFDSLLEMQGATVAGLAVGDIVLDQRLHMPSGRGDVSATFWCSGRRPNDLFCSLPFDGRYWNQ
jgi:hypothetical protein